MKLKKIINEIFVDYMRNRLSDTTEIYLNPSKKEMGSIGKEIRFTAIKKGKKVYVFDAMFFSHKDIERHLKILPSELVLKGNARKKDNEWIMTSCYDIESMIFSIKKLKKGKKKDFYKKELEKILYTDWSFVKKYIEINEYFNIQRKRYESKKNNK